jgi:hypothetical protein
MNTTVVRIRLLLGVLTGAPVTLLCLAACVREPRAPVRAETRCERACTAAADDEREGAICYACRCKEALGDLPPPEAITCARGAEIPIYRLEGGRVVETKENRGTCKNPALIELMPAEQACTPGSRLGQVVTESAIFRFVCRRAADGTAYDDMGVIGHNPKTGATCFWTALDEKRTDGVMPALDLSDGDSKKVDAFARSMQLAYEGNKCLACHDGDPFIYTAHLEGAWPWDTDAYRFGPYQQVHIAGPPTPIPHEHLVSDEAAPCTSCHRIANGRTCDTFLPSSTGVIINENLPYQPEVRRSPALARWMPHPSLTWGPTQDAAALHITMCCKSPNAPGCRWEPIPSK